MLKDANRSQLIKILNVSVISAFSVAVSCALKDRLLRGWGWEVILLHCYTGASFCLMSYLFKHLVENNIGGQQTLKLVPLIHISYLMYCCVEVGCFDFPDHY